MAFFVLVCYLRKMKSMIITLIALSFTWSISAQTTFSGTIAHTTGTRSYQLYIPAMYDGSESVPLVLNLHGYGSNNTQQMAYGNFKPIADTANFLILAPQGLNDVNNTAHWNAEWGTGVDDVGFLSALIDTISANYNVNSNRIYSTGMSNGGFMSFTLAGELSDKIAAVASVTGTMSVIQVPANTVSRPMPIMQIHGTADATVNYNGDQYFLSVDSVLNYWVAHNNCNPTPVITAVPNTNTSDGCTAERIDYLGGDNGSEVVHYKVTGGAHTWPGAPFTIGVTNRDFDASIEIWKFFSRYEKASLVKITENSEASWISLLSNNPTTGKVHFEIDPNEKVDLVVYSLEGKIVKKQIVQGSGSIDLSDNIDGIYILSFTSAKAEVATYKLIKE